MATANRRTTGKAAPKTGAASAVSTDENTTVTAEETVTVDAPTDSERLRAIATQGPEDSEDSEDSPTAPAPAPEAGAEHAPAATETTTAPGPVPAAVAEAAQLGVPVDEGIPAAAAAAPTVPHDEGQQPRDLATLRRLADTSGNDPVTPYPADGVAAPNPVLVLPEVRSVLTWAREGDPTLTGRVLADGWRAHVDGTYRFASRGDRVTAPADIIRSAAKHGILIIEE